MARRFRWYELLPEAVLAVGLTVFLVDQTDAATSAFASTKAVALMAVAAVGWLLGRVVLARRLHQPLVRTGLFALAALGALAVVVLPAYDDTTVIETLPSVAAETVQTAETPETAETAATPEAPAPRPERFRTASFRGVDHRAAGTVALYRQPDGRFVVGLEDIDIQPGPDYDVYVVPGRDREDRDGGRRLDDLRGNRGTQFYDVPPGIDLARGEWTVLVWCQIFAVPIATATPV